MARKPINQVLAEQLAHFMEERGIRSQSALARASGVAQRTIGNYMNPELRQESASGKAPSAKLAEVEKIAEALGIEPWELLRDLTPAERKLHAQMEAAFRQFVSGRDAQPLEQVNEMATVEPEQRELPASPLPRREQFMPLPARRRRTAA